MENPNYYSQEISKLKKIIVEQENTIAWQNEKIKYLEKIIDFIPCNVYWKNREGHYLGINNTLLHISGFKSIDEVIGKKLHQLIEKKYADVTEKIDEQIMSSATGIILEENWINIHGEPAIYLSHKIPLFDEQHNVIGLLGISFDITMRKKIELELQEMKELAEKQSKITHVYLNNLVANLPENFYWVDKESRVLTCNENQAKALGLTSKQLIGKNNHDIAKMLGWDPEIADSIRKNDIEVMETRQVKKIEETVLLNGEKRTFLSYKNPMIDDKDDVIGLFGLGIDITERKHMEEELIAAKEKAELANVAKSQFIRNMSHDIRTPFSGILGFAKILQKKETQFEKKEMLGYIIQSSEKLLNLLNEILELAKKTSQNVESVVKFRLQETIDQIIGISLAEIKYKNLDLKVTVSQNLPNFLLGDKLKFDRILLNLISNAVKFTANGYVAITVNDDYQKDDEVILKITVEDTGIGIPRDKYETIFEYFTRLTPAYEGNYPGSGLGLYMVKQYVTEMAGKITVTSEIGKGTIFTCLLPFKIIKENELTTEDSNMQTATSNQNNFTATSQKYILLIEDDPIAQKISKIMLEEYFGCVVDIAENGKRALEMVPITQYDSILMDIGLPDTDGFNLTKKIRALGGWYAQIPIFGLTAHTDETSFPSAQEATMNIVLTKPLSEEICDKLFFKIQEDNSVNV